MTQVYANKVIEEYLLNIIFDEKVDKSKALPSENFLATKFKVSRLTARTELTKLLNKGFLKVKKGSGYYVNPHINAMKGRAIGEEYKFSKKVIETIDNSYLGKILESTAFQIDKNLDDYIGYRKIFFDEKGEASLYINSFILKSEFEEIDLDFIKQSLISFMHANDVEVDNQVNLVEVLNANEFDIHLFGSEQKLTPVVFGILVSKKENIVEIFERRYRLEHFKLQFMKTW
ncbi:transcription regulator [Spiroplasma chinense]|uniref:Transcription regulator n=1 Tax=Spiroplasma chinense TaxID=216932 RepID=A0A5B9Y4T5_9MOLU|nr:GntR family transcriptional regulator [Spiroplasma chinense]QEH61699.1 transcription regulator [Spiroplasma chinense]